MSEMTAMRMAGVLPRVTIAAVGGALAAAAWLLWSSSEVPAGLTLPHVAAATVAAPAVVAHARHIETVSRLIGLGDLLVPIAATLVYAKLGPRFVRESAAGRIGTGMLLAMLGFGVVWIAQLPTGILGLWWQRHAGISRTGYVAWAFGNWASLGLTFLTVCLAVLVTMLLAKPLGDRWWIPAAPIFAALVLLSAFIQPFTLTQLRSPDALAPREARLTADARDLAARAHLPRIPIRIQDVDTQTTAPNAETAGIGPSRRVVLWNTLVDDFTPAQVRVVLAHELGHQARSHIWKQVAWFALLALPLAWIVARVTRRAGGLARPEAVPLGILAFTVLSVAVLPLQNVVSRHMEAEADWVALRATRDPAAATSLFQAFTVRAASDPSPPTWSYVLFDTHPTVAQRIAMVRAWEARNAPPP
jgi:STE24 endopeptidase